VSDQPLGSPTRLSAHLAVCGGAWVRLHTYPDRSPILTVSTGEVSLTVAMARTDLDETALAFVHAFADAVTRFAHDCARFTLDDGTGDASAAENRTETTESGSAPVRVPRSAGRSRAPRAA
jgi:hypothetical protein